MKVSKESLITEIMYDLMGVLSEGQLNQLKTTLILKFNNLDINEKETALVEYTNPELNRRTFNLFKAEMYIQKMSPKTITQYERATFHFLDDVNKSYADITKDDITLYLLKLESRNSPTTILNTVRFIKAFFGWLNKNDYISSNPFDKLSKMKTPENRKVAMTDQEVEKIRDACSTVKELAIVDFLLSTGVRVGEFVRLKTSDVDLLTGDVTIYATKTRKYRTVYLDAKALKHLIDYRNSLKESDIKSEYLFLNRYGQKISENTINITVGRLASSCKINKHITVHSFRKTRATTLLKKGMKPTTVSALLGHKDFTTTSKFYADYTQFDIKAEFNKYCS